MSTYWQDFPRLIAVILLVIGMLFLFLKGNEYLQRFFLMDYQGNSIAKFKDSLIGSVLISSAIFCILLVLIMILTENFSWDMFFGSLPVFLCLAMLIIPISIASSYWRSYSTTKLWGGFLPIVRERQGYAQPELADKIKIDPARIKIPRKTLITAFIIAVFIFAGIFILFGFVEWSINVWLGIIIRIFVSGLTAFGIFMLIVSSSLSRRVQKLRDGETIDDEYDF
jgi:hypothetical protein